MDSSGKKIIYYLLIVITALFALYVLVHYAVLMLSPRPQGYQAPLVSSSVRRGTIYDRNGTVLAAEVPYYSCAILLQEVDSLPNVLSDLSLLLSDP